MLLFFLSLLLTFYLFLDLGKHIGIKRTLGRRLINRHRLDIWKIFFIRFSVMPFKLNRPQRWNCCYIREGDRFRRIDDMAVMPRAGSCE